MNAAPISFFITPSAVSHQIKRLENQLGKKLFEKSGRQLVLTEQARPFAQQLIQSFSDIKNATDSFCQRQQNVVQIGAPNALAVQRIIPALSIWQQQAQDLDIRVRMLNCEDDAKKTDLDIIIGAKIDDIYYHSEHLCDEEYFPVCSTDLINQYKGDKSTLLKQATRLDLIDVNCWQLWSEITDNQPDPNIKTQWFSHTILMYQAFIANQGVALFERAIIEPDLIAGKALRLSQASLKPAGMSYFLSTKMSVRHVNSVKTVADWLTTLIIA